MPLVAGDRRIFVKFPTEEQVHNIGDLIKNEPSIELDENPYGLVLAVLALKIGMRVLDLQYHSKIELARVIWHMEQRLIEKHPQHESLFNELDIFDLDEIPF